MISEFELLRDRLFSDLSRLPFPITKDKILIKPYSSTMYGNFNQKRNLIVIYYFQDKQQTKPYSYDSLLDTCVHEYTHYVQWNNDHYLRTKGVMHDTEFYVLYNDFLKKVGLSEKVLKQS